MQSEQLPNVSSSAIDTMNATVVYRLQTPLRVLSVLLDHLTFLERRIIYHICSHSTMAPSNTNGTVPNSRRLICPASAEKPCR